MACGVLQGRGGQERLALCSGLHARLPASHIRLWQRAPGRAGPRAGGGGGGGGGGGTVSTADLDKDLETYMQD